MELWIGLLIGLVVGAAIAVLIARTVMRPRIAEMVATAEAELAEKRETAEREAENILRTSRESAQDIRLEADKAIERRYQEPGTCRGARRPSWRQPGPASQNPGTARTIAQQTSESNRQTTKRTG